MADRLKGKVAVVTGSGRNIGRATVLKLAEEGANVVVNARSNKEEAEAVAREARELGVDALAIIADVGDREQIDRMMSQALDHFGQIDILISNAAIRPHKPFNDVTQDEWERVRSVVLDGAVYCTHAVIPSMLRNQFGRLVFLAGDGAWNGSPERAHVSAAKMGLVGFARGLASEFGPQNIRANVLAPGSIDTSRANPQWYSQSGGPPTAAGIPLGRQGHVNEIASAIVFLVTDDGGYVTGQTLHVNGGSAYF
jgi:3-oxoacyl-[acyl-carrier protein] reductase